MSGKVNVLEPEERAKALARTQGLKMARSAHAYVRGNTARFYEWLESDSGRKLPEGPPIWICGDCHLGNLGPLADSDGNVDVQIRDLDQTVIGNPAHDLVRLSLSLASTARGSDLPGVTTARMLEEMIAGYELAMRDPGPDDRVPEPGVARSVKRRALGRRWKQLARERIADVSPQIPLGRKFWPLAPEEQAAIEQLIRTAEVRRLVLALNRRTDDDSVRVLDAAYWIKGCSSLGNLRYAVLVGLGRKGREDTLALVDLKEAVASVAPAARNARMPKDPAQRVVAGARALAPNLGDRMIAATLLDRPIIVRELMPQDLKLEVDQFTRREAVQAARYLAYVVGRAHGQQMDATTRAAWLDELAKQRAGDLDAPSWLWRSVVALAARHEEGYLTHCRRYALTEAN